MITLTFSPKPDPNSGMAVTKRPTKAGNKANAGGNSNSFVLSLTKATKSIRQFLHPANLWDLVVNPDRCLPMAIVLFIAEVVINAAVISKVKYTEIDWIAYMQEVEGVVNNTYDYSKLRGDTGPLVYPAGFVWFYMALYYITDLGKNIKLAQCFFAVFYLMCLSLVFRLLIRSKKVPPYVLAIMSLTSYRVHSIFVLRLFNDPVAMLFLYLAINLFADDHWTLGSIAYRLYQTVLIPRQVFKISFHFSFAVSIKMNILLFAPALFLAYLATQGGIVGTIKQLFVCASIQVILALPFLMENPVNYLKGAFDLGRVFLHKWTVNYRFLPEAIFVHKYFHLALLGGHAVLLILAAKPVWQLLSGYGRLPKDKRPSVAVQLLLLPLFFSNFIGVAMARSLHYQVKIKCPKLKL